jgi:hypothetical protein
MVRQRSHCENHQAARKRIRGFHVFFVIFDKSVSMETVACLARADAV